MTPNDRPVRGERFYRALLCLYPKAFRRRYGADMIAFYRERASGLVNSRQMRTAMWARLLPDLLASAFAERIAALAGRADVRSSLESRSALPPEEPMSIFQQDLRFALRGMAHRPGFTAVVLATLALGIGANAAIFSVVDAVLLRPLPFEDVDRIVSLGHKAPYSSVSEPEFVDYQRGVAAFEKLAAYSGMEVTITVSDQPVRAAGARVSRDFFTILGVKPQRGRVFAADEFSHLTRTRITVISSGLWRQQFAADPAVVGKVIQINGAPFRIIGVMPDGFGFPSARAAFWTPWRLNPDSLWTRNNHYLALVGKLAPGGTVAQANAQVRTLDQRWMHDFPETYFPSDPLQGVVTTLRDDLLGPTRPYLLALLGAVGFILLIACVNVANLLLVRGEGRRKEFAIRTALGASGSRMVRQMLTESMLLALFGAMLGLVIAWAGSRALVAFAPTDLPRLEQVGVDYRVVAFTAAIAVLTGIIFGLAPALRGGRDGAEPLRDGRKTSGAGGSRIARRGLVVTEVALAVILSAGSGLLIRSLTKLQAMDMGFDPKNVLTMELTLPARKYSDTTADAFFRELLTKVRGLPGVTTVAADGMLPISGDDNSWSIMVDGRVARTIAEAPTAKPDEVTPDYFKTLGIRLTRGRTFGESDRLGAPPVVVINETMAKQLWPGVDPIGHTLKMYNPASPWATIVGVVGDVRSRGIQETVPPTMYFPYSQSGTSAYYMPRTMSLVVRTARDPAALAPQIRGIVRSLDAQVPIDRVAPMETVVASSIASRRFTTVLLGGFAALALTLAGIGIYGVISYGVSQRTYEIGVRMALGATASSVVRLVMAEGVNMTVAGLALGVAGAAVVDRSLDSLLIGITASDPATFSGVVAILIAVAACACAIPARRATGVSPTDALRNG